MFNLGIPEIGLVLFVALIVFGPKRLPEMARSMGKFIRGFQDETQRAVADLKAGMEPATTGIFDTPDAGSEQPGSAAVTTPFIPAEEMRKTRARKQSRAATKPTATTRSKPGGAKPASTRAKPTASRGKSSSSRAKPAARSAQAKKSTPSRVRQSAPKPKRKR